MEVRQITSLGNSVRWKNVPSRPQFGVFAMRDLPKGYPILCYKVFSLVFQRRICCCSRVCSQGLLCHSDQEASSNVHWTSNYCVNAGEGINLAIDSARMGNEVCEKNNNNNKRQVFFFFFFSSTRLDSSMTILGVD